MANYIHFLEFDTPAGKTLVRVDHVATILEAGDKKGAIFLLLQNNIKVEVLGETRASIMQRLYGCGGGIIVHAKDGPSQGLQALMEAQEEAPAAEDPA